MIQEIALTELGLNDAFNDEITNIGNIPMPSGTKFADLVAAMPFTFAWVANSFGVEKPCMLRICPSPAIIGATTNSVPYDVPCSDFTLFSLLGLKAHPVHRPK